MNEEPRSWRHEKCQNLFLYRLFHDNSHHLYDDKNLNGFYLSNDGGGGDDD